MYQLSVSPKNNDEGLLDIHSILNGGAVSDRTSKSYVPVRSCLDLYEENLTGEGTAKEATYNDYNALKLSATNEELKKKFTKLDLK